MVMVLVHMIWEQGVRACMWDNKRAQKYQYAKSQTFPERLELGRVKPGSTQLTFGLYHMFSICLLRTGSNANKLVPHIMHPFDLLECKSETLKRTRWPLIIM